MSTRPVLVTAVAWLGIAAQLVFTVLWLIAPAWQGAGYDVVRDSISDLYADTAPGGAALVVVITLCGLATILFALVGVARTLRGGWGVAAGIALALSIFGLGDALTPFERLACRLADSGCSPADQLATPGGALDAAFSTIGVFVLVVAAALTAVALRRTPQLRAWAWPAVAVAIVLLAFVLVLSAATSVSGLAERGIALVGAAGIVALALGTLRRPLPEGEAEELDAVDRQR